MDTLLQYWVDKGRLGTLSELLEHDCNHKLAEENPARVKRDPLDLNKARRGAEALAAAVILTRRFTFPIPDSSDTSPPDTLDPRAVLIDWRDEEIAALLGRALFDEAAYGKIRFHHRGLIDYLASCWFKRLIEANCPQIAVKRLLFRDIYGRTVVPPSLAPVAGWLAGRFPDLRRRLMEIDPDVLLRQGDPSLIPLPERHALLESVAGRDRLRGIEDREQLGRLADPSLAPTINRLLRDDAVAADVKNMLLLIAREGRLAGCGKACLVIAGNPTADKTQRLRAVQTLAAADDENRLKALAIRLLNGPELSEHLATAMCEAPYPRVLDEDGLAELLGKVPSISERAGYYLPHHLTAQIEGELPVAHLPSMISVLVDLSLKEPWIIPEGERRPSRVSWQFSWVWRPLTAAVRRVLAQDDLAATPPELVTTAIDRLGRIRQYGEFDGRSDDSLQDALAQHPEIRTILTRRSLARRRKTQDEDKIWLWSVYGSYALWNLAHRDIPWLLDEARNEPEQRDRQMAFKLAIQLWHETGRPFRLKLRFMALAATNYELWPTYRRNMSSALGRTWFRLRHWRFSRLRFTRRRHRLSNRYWFWRKRLGLWWRATSHRERLRRGEDWRLLYALMGAADGRDHVAYRLDKSAVERIAKIFGSAASHAARTGLKRYWRRWDGGHSYASVVALVGLNIDLEDGLDIRGLSRQDAETAARLSPHTYGGWPSWLADLIAANHEAVRAVFAEWIAEEYALPVECQHGGRTVSALRRDKAEAPLNLCAPILFAAIGKAEPDNFFVLSDVVDALTLHGKYTALIPLAERYAHAALASSNEDRLILWTALWLQLDAEPAMDFLELLPATDFALGDRVVLSLAANLYSRDGYHAPLIADPSYARPESARRLLLLLYRHIRRAEDIEREGAHRPGPRDDAQRFRWHVMSLLTRTPGRRAHDTLLSLAAEPVMSSACDLLLHYAVDRAKQDADGLPWSAEDVAHFARQYERLPTNADELFALVRWRLEDIIEQAERGDFSLRGHFREDDDEEVLQKWLADKLNDLRRDAYDVAREPEVAFHKKPDIRLFRAGMDPVTIEVKWAHKNWSFTELRDALEHQLLGQYMLTNRSRHGILLLANLKPDKKWQPTGELRLGFRATCERLDREAQKLVAARGRGEMVSVIGVELA